MRIALITPGFSANEDDWCIPALLNLVRELAKKHEVVVFALRYPHLKGKYRVFDAEVHAFGGMNAGGLKRLALMYRAFADIVRMHRERPFDVIHSFWSDEPGFLSVAAGRLTRTPSVVSLMGGEIAGLPDIGYGGQLGRANRWLTRIALCGARAVTVGSSYLERIAEPLVPAQRLCLVPLGIDSSLFNPQSSCVGVGLAGAPAILSVGSLVPVKDHALLLDVLAAIRPDFPHAQLHIVGEGPLREHLEQRARLLDISSRVTFHGEISHQCLPAYYQSGGLLLVTSRHESQSMVALEAAACGCPVLGTSVGAVPEISPASRSIAPTDAGALSDALLAVLSDPHALIRLRSEGIAAVENRYTLERTVPALCDLYNRLL